jgi:hypothetical protein
VSLLTIIQAASAEIGLTVPTAVVGNTDLNVVRLLRMANRVGRDLVSRFEWGALRTEAVFVGLAQEAQTGALPADCDRIISETLWDRTNRRLISGSAQAVQWQGLEASRGTPLARIYTLRGGVMRIFPALSGGEAVYFEYISNKFCQSATGTAQDAWAADTDMARLDEELFTLGVAAYYLRALNLPYTAQMDEFDMRVINQSSSDQPGTSIMSAGDAFGEWRNFTGTPPADNSGNDSSLPSGSLGSTILG